MHFLLKCVQIWQCLKELIAKSTFFFPFQLSKIFKLRFQLETDMMSPWALCPGRCFWVLTASLMLSGLTQFPSSEYSGLPVLLLRSHPCNSKPPWPSAKFVFPFQHSVCNKKRRWGAWEMRERVRGIKLRLMMWASTWEIHQGRSQRTGGKWRNGWTQDKEERWMSRDSWVTWLLSE